MTDIRIGDRFKVEVEVVGFYQRSEKRGLALCKGDGACFDVSTKTLLASERIERLIAVGDRVRYASNPQSTTGVVRLISNYEACVEFYPANATSYLAVEPVSSLVSVGEGETE